MLNISKTFEQHKIKIGKSLKRVDFDCIFWCSTLYYKQHCKCKPMLPFRNVLNDIFSYLFSPSKNQKTYGKNINKWLNFVRPCLRAKVSAVKLEAIGPEEKDKELDVLHLEHVTYTPAPKREGTDPSVHTWISDGGREDSLLEAVWSRAVLLPVQSGMKGETVKWVVDHGGK